MDNYFKSQAKQDTHRGLAYKAGVAKNCPYSPLSESVWMADKWWSFLYTKLLTRNYCNTLCGMIQMVRL